MSEKNGQNGHIDRHYGKQLVLLKEKLLQMASMVEKAIAKSVKSLIERDSVLSEQVIDEDKEIDTLELEIEELCLKLLALRQPLAGDLRFIISAMKINNDLERIGDTAMKIAKRNKKLLKFSPIDKFYEEIPHLAKITQEMLRDSIYVLVNQDSTLAREVCKRDDEVDDLNRRIFNELLSYMSLESKSVDAAVNFIFTSRHLERIADLSTNICEDVIYIVEGKTFKHKLEEKEQKKKSNNPPS